MTSTQLTAWDCSDNSQGAQQHGAVTQCTLPPTSCASRSCRIFSSFSAFTLTMDLEGGGFWVAGPPCGTELVPPISLSSSLTSCLSWACKEGQNHSLGQEETGPVGSLASLASDQIRHTRRPWPLRCNGTQLEAFAPGCQRRAPSKSHEPPPRSHTTFSQMESRQQTTSELHLLPACNCEAHPHLCLGDTVEEAGQGLLYCSHVHLYLRQSFGPVQKQRQLS